MKNYEVALNILKEKFGFSDFKEGQFETINKLMNGQDVLSILPTGAGKSLIYQLFGYYKQKPIVIITPLISLMYDQVQRMNMMGEDKAVTLNSDFDKFQKKVILNNINQYRFIFISPESIAQAKIFNLINQLNIGLFVIDEAHCISTWGNDFRPAYLNLKNIIYSFNKRPQLLLLTATASKKVIDDINQTLQLENLSTIKKKIDRKNIYLKNIDYESENQKDQSLFYLLSNLAGAGIVYFSSKNKANEMARQLIDYNSNLKIGVYHADIDEHDRYIIQQQFMNNEINIVFATSAFGMGIDKSDIRFVIHYHMPQNIEDFFQEIGRAGRDNKESISILMYTKKDEFSAKNLVDYALPDEAEINQFDHLAKANEDQEKIMKYYDNLGYSKSDLISLFKNLKLRKLADLDYMIYYTKNVKTCRRELLMSYFNESGIKHSEFCCDIDETDITSTFFSKKRDENINNKLTWKDIMQRLF